MNAITEAAHPDKSTWGTRALLTAVAVVVLALPWYGNNYLTYMATLIAINIIATMGLNITVGYAGLLSVGHAAFVGVALMSVRCCQSKAYLFSSALLRVPPPPSSPA